MSELARSAAPPDREHVGPAGASSRPPEATVRALVSGAVIGVILAAGNVYTSLKVGVIDGCSVTAALLAFAVFGVWRRSDRTPYGALENNITQTAASSAAMMSFCTGVVGPIPALALQGLHFTRGAVILFGAAIAVLGIFVAALLRRRLVVEEGLPFPTGAATGEVIQAVFSARRVAVRRILLLAVAAAVAGAITWFREGRPAVIPQGFMFGGTLAGIAAATLGLGIACSPLMLSIGAMVGTRTAAGMMVGALIARVLIAPWLLRSGIVANVETGTLNSWIVWPSLGLMTAGSFLPLFLDAGTIVRSFRQLGAFLRRSTGTPRATAREVSPRFWGPVLAVTLAVLLAVGWLGFGIHPLVTLMALAAALVLANVSARAAGETDFPPVGSVGTAGVMTFASRGTASATMAGSLMMGLTSQTAQMLWAFRAGHRVGASPRAQVGAQILGALVGAIVTVPVYLVIVSSYGLGNERMPATVALSWKATAQAMHGLSALPRLGAPAALAGIGAGAALTLIGRARLGSWLPSAAAIGVGFMLPFSLTLAACAGALLVLVARAVYRPGIDQNSIQALAAGGIAGESIVGVIIAILISAGVL